MMKTKALLGLSLLFITLMAGCSSDNEKNDEPIVEPVEFALSNFTNTGCKSTMSAPRRSMEANEYFELKATKDGGLYVKHVNATFNCASSKFKAEASLEEQAIKVTELDATHAETMANCVCSYDLGYILGPLKEGATYDMTIITTTELTPEQEAMGWSFDKTETTFTFTYSLDFDDVFPVRYEGETEI